MKEVKNNYSETQDSAIKTKEQKIFENEFIKTGDIEKFPNGHISYIQDNVYGLFSDKGKLSYFMKENGEIILNIVEFRKMQFINETKLASGYLEVVEGGASKLYKVIGFDNDNKPVLENNQINPYSPEYFKAWIEINFNFVMIGKSILKKNPRNMFSSDELKILEKDILADIDSGAISIEDIEAIFGLDNNGKINKELQKISKSFFEEAIQRIVQEKLILQCGDERLDELKQGMTEARLKAYFEKGYIKDKKIVENCIIAMRAKELKKNKDKKVIDNTKDSLK